MVFSVSFLFVSCPWSRFLYCVYHDICIKHLINNIVLFLLIASLHLCLQVLSFSFVSLLQIFSFLLCICYQMKVAIVILMVFTLKV